MKLFTTIVLAIIAMMAVGLAFGKEDSSGVQGTNNFEQFVFIGFYAGGAGPMPVSPANHFLVVSSDGCGQTYKVANSPVGDQLVSLEEKQVNASALFGSISSNFSKLPSSPIHSFNNGGMADEYVAPNIQVVAQVSRDKVYQWEGKETELPKELKGLIGLVETNLETGQAVPVNKPYAYVVANWLSRIAAGNFRKDGIMYAIGVGTNTASAIVLESLQHPFQLVSLNQETNPFAPYCRNFRPGLRTLEASYLGTDFQIRSIAVTTNSIIGVNHENK